MAVSHTGALIKTEKNLWNGKIVVSVIIQKYCMSFFLGSETKVPIHFTNTFTKKNCETNEKDSHKYAVQLYSSTGKGQLKS